MSWHHRCSGSLSPVLLSTTMKWFFQVWVAFSATLWQWSLGGTSWNVRPESRIDCLNAASASLSRTWRRHVSTQAFIRVRAQVGARISSPPVLFWSALHPNRVAVSVKKDHLVLVTSSGCVWKFSIFVRVDCMTGVICFYEDVLLYINGGGYE
jgi:hypothetical protein